VEKVAYGRKYLNTNTLVIEIAVENPVGNSGKPDVSEDFSGRFIFFNSLHSSVFLTYCGKNT
jgi:hypothetical protein